MRWTDRVVNDEDEAQEFDLSYIGTFGWFNGRVVDTSSGDDDVDEDDVWVVFDADDDGDGEPALALVWGSPDSEVRPDELSVRDGDGVPSQVAVRDGAAGPRRAASSS